MDKGIFYLVCSAVLLSAVVFSAVETVKVVQNQCVGKTVVEKVAVEPSPSPTATPAATLKPVFKAAPKVLVTPGK